MARSAISSGAKKKEWRTSFMLSTLVQVEWHRWRSTCDYSVMLGVTALSLVCNRAGERLPAHDDAYVVLGFPGCPGQPVAPAMPDCVVYRARASIVACQSFCVTAKLVIQLRHQTRTAIQRAGWVPRI